jgi:molybdopterin synthase catalytic subunit
VIHVRVRLFAMHRELAGTREVALEMTPGATVEDAWRALVDRVPALAPGRPTVRFAVDGAYADADAPLPDGAELAVVPPVSGGAGDGERILEIREEAFGLEVLAELGERLATPADGAVATFVGRTRESPGTAAPGQEAAAAAFAGERVTSLEYEAHETMAIRILGDIADEIRERFGVTRIAIVHRVGAVPLGETSVAVVACSPHRDAAFDPARYAIDETKSRAPIWKAEQFASGHVWIGEPARTGPGPGRPSGR